MCVCVYVRYIGRVAAKNVRACDVTTATTKARNLLNIFHCCFVQLYSRLPNDNSFHSVCALCVFGVFSLNNNFLFINHSICVHIIAKSRAKLNRAIFSYQENLYKSIFLLTIIAENYQFIIKKRKKKLITHN